MASCYCDCEILNVLIKTTIYKENSKNECSNKSNQNENKNVIFYPENFKNKNLPPHNSFNDTNDFSNLNKSNFQIH